MNRSVWLVAAWLAMVMAPGWAASSSSSPEEQVTGEGGRFLHYSSTQVRVVLSAEERASFEQARDRLLPGSKLAVALEACNRALADMGYEQIEVDGEFNMVRAERHEKLISASRAMLRGVLKMKMSLPGKPDHQSFDVLVAARPAADGKGVWLRARFLTTVWDSNGDSRTKVVSDPAFYKAFFDRVAARL